MIGQTLDWAMEINNRASEGSGGRGSGLQGASRGGALLFSLHAPPQPCAPVQVMLPRQRPICQPSTRGARASSHAARAWLQQNLPHQIVDLAFVPRYLRIKEFMRP